MRAAPWAPLALLIAAGTPLDGGTGPAPGLLLAAAVPRRAPPPRLLSPADIDAELAVYHRAARITPAPLADDLAFLRGVTLDLAGVIPSVRAIATFRGDVRPDRRVRLVENLLESRRFAERWAEVLRKLLLGRRGRGQAHVLRVFDQWLTHRLFRRVGLDRIAREVIAVEGTVMDNPAVAVVLSFEESRENMAGQLARAFLGVQVQCAQCHDHPFEPWRRTDFYGLAAYFARARRFEVPTVAYEKLRSGEIQRAEELAPYLAEHRAQMLRRDSPAARQAQHVIDHFRELWTVRAADPLAYRGHHRIEDVADSVGLTQMFLEAFRREPKRQMKLPLLYEGHEGEIEIPPDEGPDDPPAEEVARRPAPIPPRPLAGEAPRWPDPGAHRRAALADWVTAPTNPFFARAMANRVWAHLMGRGLVEPIDNIAHPAERALEGLLDRLAGHLVASGYDLRALVRLIVLTRVYQRAIRSDHPPREGGASGAGREAVPGGPDDRALFARAPVRPLDPEQIFAAILEATGIEHTFEHGPGRRLEQMKKDFSERFVHAYEVDEPGETVSFQGTIQQALFILNGPAFNRTVLAARGGTIEGLRALASHPERVRHLVLAALGRDPTAAEEARLVEYVRARSEDPTWGRPPAAPGQRPGAGPWWRRVWRGVAGTSPPVASSSRGAVASPGPRVSAPPLPAAASGGRQAGEARAAPVPAARRLESLARAYEDVLFCLMASTEFITNH